MGLISFLAGAFKQVSGRGKGTRPDGSPWWQVRVRLPKGFVIENDPYGNERRRWHTKDGQYKQSRDEPKRNEEEKKARTAGHKAGKVHGAKIGKRAKSLRDSEITRRANKLAADAGYRDDGLIAQFVEGYADAIASAAQ